MVLYLPFHRVHLLTYELYMNALQAFFEGPEADAAYRAAEAAHVAASRAGHCAADAPGWAEVVGRVMNAGARLMLF